jgi:hypothetical protein
MAKAHNIPPSETAKLKNGILEEQKNALMQQLAQVLQQTGAPPQVAQMILQAMSQSSGKGAAGGPPVPPGASTLQSGPPNNVGPSPLNALQGA